MENELYSFIVDSNLEHSCCDQCSNPKTAKKLRAWFQIDGGDLDG